MSYEAWGEPEDVDDPLEGVAYPRERKPWKRDRERVRLVMQAAILERRQNNPMVEAFRGDRCAATKDHAARIGRLNELHYEIFRFRMGMGFGPKRWHRLRAFATILEDFALVPYFDKVPLP
ncbi:hypothetical protein [Sphingobium sp.]|uniref:hypothetical protein n=1 Tax=Sphingobium sp. TaxID=1912891 RepID=UPI000DAF99E5|nr:hypothetical protein [Sphingobium sp.]PZU71085.1 MAG: hypothetical protein DI540_01125 [Sphingobium sp.]